MSELPARGRVLREVALAEGYHAEPFAMPTGLFLRITPIDGVSGAAEVHRMKRIKDTGVDRARRARRARLTLVDEIFNDVIAHKTTRSDLLDTP